MKINIATPVMALCLVFANASAFAAPDSSKNKEDNKTEQNTGPRAIKDIKVVVTVNDMADDLPIDIRNLENFKVGIQTDIESLLQKAGFKTGGSDSPILKIAIMLLEMDSHKYAFHVSVNLVDSQRLNSNHSLIGTESKWREGKNIIIKRIRLKDVRDTIDKYVEEFINDCLVTNQK